MTPTPWVQVVCDNPECPEYGKTRTVLLNPSDTTDSGGMVWEFVALYCNCAFTSGRLVEMRRVGHGVG